MSKEIAPEVQALIDEAVERATEALSTKNRELLGELKAAKAKAKGADIDPAEHAALQSKVEELTAQLDKSGKTSQKEIEKLAKSLTEKESALTGLLIDGGLTDALVKAGVRPELMNAAKAMLKGKASIKADAGNYSALMGDKPLSDAVKDWATGDEGKHFITAPASTGGGAPGGGTKAPAGTKRSAMSYEQRAAYVKEHGQDKYLALPL